MKKLIIIILLFLLLTTNVGQAQFSDSEPMFGQMLNLGHWSTDGLVFYWRGIPAGNAVDESLLGNHGTITGATWVGNQLNFVAASSQYVSSLVPTTTPSAVTLIVRFKTGSSGTARPLNWGDISTAATYYALDANIGNDFSWWVRNTTQSLLYTTITPAANTWYTLAGTADGSSITLYLDGSFAISTGQSDTPPDNLDVFGIGALVRDGRLYSDCDVSDAKIYNRALSASEIAALYINPNLPMQQPPIWLFKAPTVVGGSLQPIIDGGIGPAILGGSVIR